MEDGWLYLSAWYQEQWRANFMEMVPAHIGILLTLIEIGIIAKSFTTTLFREDQGLAEIVEIENIRQKIWQERWSEGKLPPDLDEEI